MSLPMLNEFTQTNGYIPQTALTVVEKRDDQVNMTAGVESVDVEETIATAKRLIDVRARIIERGMCRADAIEIMQIAPEALPSGYGVEAYTVLPSKIMLGYGTESILTSIVGGLTKAITFLIKKLTQAYEFMVRLYEQLTGIRPTAYRVAQRAQYCQEMSKQINHTLGKDLSEFITDDIRKGIFDESSATVVIDGMFNDADAVCSELARISPLIKGMQREIDDLAIVAGLSSRRFTADCRNAKLSSDDLIEAITTNLAGLDKARAPLMQTINKVTQRIIDSNLFKSPDQKRKAIITQLKSSVMSEVLAGLEELSRSTQSFVPSAETDFNMVTDADINSALDMLSNISVPDSKAIREVQANINKMQVKDYIRNDQPQVTDLIYEFFVRQQEVSTMLDIARKYTANYASATVKFATFKTKVREIALVQLVRNDPVEIIAEFGNERVEKIQEKIRAYLKRVAS